MNAEPRAVAVGSLTLHDFEPTADHLCDDAVRGLTAARRKLPPKYFYDERGAKLFERICELEAYYPTRTELAILESRVAEIAARLGPECRVVEFGSGSGIKTRILLRELADPVAYVPVDISRGQLAEFALSVAAEHPSLEVLPVCADYTGAYALPSTARPSRRTVAFFPGSTIGNFEPAEAEGFLRQAHALCGPGGAFVVGVDQWKDPARIERAYNDPEGVTAEFNLNLLARMNRECGADFELGSFRHEAVFDREEGRIEMRLVATRDQTVTLPPGDTGKPGAVVRFAAGDAITTEYSYKYRPERFRALAERAGWVAEERWSDDRDWFGVWLLTRG